MPSISDRMKNFAASPTTMLVAKVAELKSAGKDIVSLNVGEPDFDTPEYIKEAANQAMVAGFTKYTAVAGIIELREAIAAKLQKDNGVAYKASEISVAGGAKQAIFNTLMAIVSPGDEVILPIPCWVSYTEMIKIAGGVPVFVEVSEKNGFDLDIEAIKAAITPKTKGIIICTPNNPSGAVYKEETLRALAALALEHDFYVIADEIYEKLIYDGEKHFSIASISSEVKERTITINGYSKAYAMTGWRLGYAAANQEVIGAINKIQSQTTSSVNSIAQKAGIAALEGPQADMEAMVVEFAKRRCYVMERLNAIKGITCVNPKGAFYVLPDVSACFGKSYQGQVIKDDSDFASLLLTEKQVALVPGIAFYAPGKVRISYSNSMENLKKAMDRIEAFVNELA